MSRIFDMDSPLMRILNKFADLMWLNILTLICCIPIVTIGPALSAAHYVELKMYRNEEGYITRDFFKAFKVNFKQGFILGVINLLLLTIFVTDIFLMNENSNIHIPGVAQVLIMAGSHYVCFLCGMGLCRTGKIYQYHKKYHEKCFCHQYDEVPLHHSHGSLICLPVGAFVDFQFLPVPDSVPVWSFGAGVLQCSPVQQIFQAAGGENFSRSGRGKGKRDLRRGKC